MANPERGEVRLPVNGHEFTLKLTTNLIASLEEKSGKLWGRLLTEAGDLGISSIRWVIWGLLQEHHAKEFPRVELVGDLIDRGGGVAPFIDAINKAIVLNTAEPSQAGDGNPPTPGTGDDSMSKPAVSG